MSNILNPLDFPLWGSRLIEASAGTGKTWTIEALYVRLVLGHGAGNAYARALRPSEILVMTFTRAATRELSDRIRARLLKAARCFRGEAPTDPHDTLLTELIAAYPEGPQRSNAAWLLATAAEGMDDASVHTIDAWCQRMLREHAFDSGCLFDEELMADERVLLTEAAQDYWRQQCYPLAAQELAVALGVWNSVEALVQDVKELANQPLPHDGAKGSLADCIRLQLDARASTLRTLGEGWLERSRAMQEWLDLQTAPTPCPWDRRKLAKGNYTKWLTMLAEWARDPENRALDLTQQAVHRLSPAGLLEARTDGRLPDDLPGHFEAFSALMKAHGAMTTPAVAMRLHAASCVTKRMEQLKRQAGTFGFADMLHRLNEALGGANGKQLRERILLQYPVALVDEFQDTSPVQFSIFDRLYRTAENDPSTALLLIGDPKQSIYGFRGADIYSYLGARRATAGRHYVLGTNHRSTQHLVSAVNQWFKRAEDRAGDGAFLFRDDQDNPLPYVPVAARGRKEHFRTGQGLVSALSIHHDMTLRSATHSRGFFSARCAEQIVTWLNDPEAGFEQEGEPFRRLRPADIAILVRTGTEAAAVRRELRARGVTSVYLSDKDSVFDSDEARDLAHWLRAIASPQDVRLVRAGLATRTVGLSLEELAWLAASDEAFEARCEQLRGLHGVWQANGVLTMLRKTLHQLDLPARWLAEPDGERRLTNFLHLAELLQGASAQLDGDQALIRWLVDQMQEDGASADEQIVRLESDADLVKVITVHKSKGLEYPIVCLPFACSFRQMERRNTAFVKLAAKAGERELLLQYDDEQLLQADRDRLREDLRLLYVALTRARHALWLGFAALKVGNGKACLTTRSAAGCLLAGTVDTDPEALLLQLQDLASASEDITLHAAQDEIPRTRLSIREDAAELREQKPYTGDFDRSWSIGSFSSLVRALSAPDSTLHPSLGVRPADDEASGAIDLVEVATATVARDGAPVWHRFERGAMAGNFLHDQLEWLAGEGFSLQETGNLAERLLLRCERAGRGAHGNDVVQWLAKVVRTPLPGLGVSLQDLQGHLPEMEFWLPAERLQAKLVDTLCQQYVLPGLARQPLPERELHGMLMGFADLVFEHDGRYWVLDYKSNSLGDSGADYTSDALQAAMVEHRYDVQASLYLLALHRLLRTRLGKAYDPARQLGGAIYYFLRGIDGPQMGVYSLSPSLDLLEGLGAMLNEQGSVA